MKPWENAATEARPMFMFAHLETYSRKANKAGQSTAFVFGEARRAPSCSAHVEAPQPPQVVFGKSVEEVEALHDERVSEARVTIKGGKTKAIRQDQHTLCTVIASHPGGPAEDVADWERRTVDWLRAQYGDQLVSVIRHVDEEHPHLHAYLLSGDGEMRAKKLHPGVEAKAKEVERQLASGADAKTANKLGDKAYKEAMREWLDGYHQQVGIPCGMARIGPGRRRLSRADHQAEKATLAAQGRTIRAAEQAGDRIAGAKEIIRKAQEEARRIAAESKALSDQLREREKQLAKGEQQLARDRQKLQGELEGIRTLGGKLGAFWGGFSWVQERFAAAAEARLGKRHKRDLEAKEKALEGVRAEVVTLQGQVGQLELQLVQVSQSRDLAIDRALRAERGEGERERAALAERDAERERRVQAEAEREDFRGRWAVADNRVQEIERGRRLH